MQAIGDHGLVVSLGPALDLLDADRPGLGHFFVTFRAVLIDRLPTMQQETVGQVGVFGQRGVVPSANFAQRAQPHAGHGPAVLRNQAKIHAGLLVDLVAAGPLQIQQTSEQVGAAVHRHYASHDTADFRIEERSGELPDQAGAGNVVGVEDQDHLGLDQFHCVFERGRLAAFPFLAVKWANSSG